MHRSETSWPSQIQGKPEGNEYLAEEKKETIIQLTVPQDNQLVSLEDYSSFIKLIRVTAWIKRFINNVKQQGQRSGLLTSEEIIEAEKFWIKTTQNDTFSMEIKLLRDQRQVQKTSKIKMLNPNIDCDGIVRVGGRLQFSDNEEEVKHPIILPADHRFTFLLIAEEHR